MCGFSDVSRQLRNINNRCHHLARNLNDAYEKQGSVCYTQRRCFMRHSLQITADKTDILNCGSSVGQRAMLRIATAPTSVDLTGLVLFFGTNILTAEQAWGKETGHS